MSASSPLSPQSDAGQVAKPVPASASTTALAKPSASPRPSRARTAAPDSRITGQPGFVLHSYPYKETSLIIDLLSRDHGRIALVAKGAKRPHSKLRGVLQTFQPLSVNWTGKAEVRTLIAAEWVGGLLPLEKSALLCGFYLNELLVKLLARDDPHPELFDHYVATLNKLAHGESPPIVLRQFERALLKASGVAADLTRCTLSRALVDADGEIPPAAAAAVAALALLVAAAAAVAARIGACERAICIVSTHYPYLCKRLASTAQKKKEGAVSSYAAYGMPVDIRDDRIDCPYVLRRGACRQHLALELMRRSGLFDAALVDDAICNLATIHRPRAPPPVQKDNGDRGE